MKVVFAVISTVWFLLSITKLVLVFEDVDVLNTHNFDVFLGVNLGSPCINIASLILIIFYYTNTLPPTSVLITTFITTIMTFGYLASWLSFGINLSTIAVKKTVDLSQLQSGLLPYAFIDCVLICTQLAMIARESSWFLMNKRAELGHMQQGPPLSTLINSVIFLTLVTSIIQFLKIIVIGMHWPLSNDATSVFGVVSAIFTLCNTVVYITYNPSMKIDVVQGTASLVMLSMANLLVWASAGSSLLMMELESKESYQMLFGLDVATGLAQILGIALIQYLAHNLHAVRM